MTWCFSTRASAATMLTIIWLLFCSFPFYDGLNCKRHLISYPWWGVSFKFARGKIMEILTIHDIIHAKFFINHITSLCIFAPFVTLIHSITVSTHYWWANFTAIVINWRDSLLGFNPSSKLVHQKTRPGMPLHTAEYRFYRLDWVHSVNLVMHRWLSITITRKVSVNFMTCKAMLCNEF